MFNIVLMPFHSNVLWKDVLSLLFDWESDLDLEKVGDHCTNAFSVKEYYSCMRLITLEAKQRTFDMKRKWKGLKCKYFDGLHFENADF